MVRRIVAGFAGLGLALALSQFPEYAQQYTQRLGGAVDELRVITEDFDRAAEEGGLDRTTALARYSASSDAFLADRGRAMGGVFARYEVLRATLAEIEGADAATRLKNLPAYLDTDIGQRTLAAYRPAVPLTAEALLYAVAGFGLGYLVVAALGRLLGLALRRRPGKIRRSPGF